MFIFHLLDMTKPCAEPLCDAEIYGHHNIKWCDTCRRERVSARKVARRRRRMQEDAAFAERYRKQQRDRERVRRADPKHREQAREYQRELRRVRKIARINNPEYRDSRRKKPTLTKEQKREQKREYNRAYHREKYKDPEYRRRLLERAREKYHKVPRVRQQKRERYMQLKTPCVDCGSLTSPTAMRCLSCSTKAMWRDTDFLERTFARLDKNKKNRYQNFHTARRLIHARDNKRCQMCGGFPDSIDVHHIDVDTNNQHWSNLISLCDPCHDGIVHPAYNNGSKASMQADLTRKAEVQSARMSAEWHDEYGALLERIEMRAPLPERHEPTQQMRLPFVIQ